MSLNQDGGQYLVSSLSGADALTIKSFPWDFMGPDLEQSNQQTGYMLEPLVSFFNLNR